MISDISDYLPVGKQLHLHMNDYADVNVVYNWWLVIWEVCVYIVNRINGNHEKLHVIALNKYLSDWSTE